MLVFVYDDDFFRNRAGGIVAGEEGLACCELAHWSRSVMDEEALNWINIPCR